jgi:hypothetical protein
MVLGTETAAVARGRGFAALGGLPGDDVSDEGEDHEP